MTFTFLTFGGGLLSRIMKGLRLVCYSFMDVNRRHENPGSGTKDIITHDTANSIS